MKTISLSPFSRKETEAQRGNLLVGSRAGLESDQLTPSQALFQPAPRWAQGSEFQGGPEAVYWIQRGRAGAEAPAAASSFCSLGWALNLSFGTFSVEQGKDIYLAEFV